MDITIKEFHLSDSLWNSYVQNHEYGTIYHLSEWRKAIERTFQLNNSYHVALRNGRICGLLPIFIIKTVFSGIKAVSIPYAVYGGILADDYEIEDALIEFAIDFAQTNRLSYLEFRYFYNANLNLMKKDSHVTYIKRLAEDSDSILASIPRKSRASIRNGYKKYNLRTKIHRDLDVLYRLYCLNKRKLGSPVYPRTFFENLLQEFGDRSQILTVYYGEHPIASVLYFYFKETCLPYFSGSDSKYYYTNANNVMYYELMKHARSEGYIYFDFGRSRINSGSGYFKKNMGFEPVPLHYYYYSSKSEKIPDISPSNKKFELLGNIWKRLPLTLTQVFGPKIVKHLP